MSQKAKEPQKPLKKELINHTGEGTWDNCAQEAQMSGVNTTEGEKPCW